MSSTPPDFSAAPPPPPPSSELSRLAIASLVLGLLVIVPLAGILTGLLAAILGIIAILRISRSRGQLRGMGLAVAGLALGTVGGIFMQGLLGAMAIPAFTKVRETSQEKAIVNNLRQYASASQQYMLDEGVARVTYEDIVGPGRYIQSLEAVAGEDYRTLEVEMRMTQLSVETDDGRVISYSF